MKRFVLFSVTLLLHFNLLAQVTFEQGYFITESFDSVVCKIKNTDRRENPTEFQFMLLNSNEIQTRAISNTREFAILNNSKFIRSSVNIDRSSPNIEQLSSSRNPIFKKETLFLKVIVEGAASLYSYTEGSLERFFYKTQGNPIEQLVFKTFIQDERTVLENNTFRQQLLSHVKCSYSTGVNYESLRYSKNVLRNYFIKYNECSGSDYTEYKTQKSNWIHLRLRPGLHISNLSLNSTLYPQLDLTFTNSLGIRFGTEIEIIMPFNKNKWAIFLEPNYKQIKLRTEKEFERFGFGTGYFSMRYNTLEFPMGLRYYIYLNKKSKIFTNANFSIDLPINTQINYDTELGSLKLPPRTGYYFAFGVGYDFNTILCFELRYNIPHEILNMDNDTYSTSAFSNLTFMVGYALF